MKLICTSIAASGMFLAATSNVPAADSERRDLGAHEHGVTTLSIALDDDVLTLELEGPAMNFVGFEHPPRTDDQKRAVAEALEALNNDSSLFQTDPDAQCALLEAETDLITDTDQDDDHEDHDDEHGEDHEDEHDSHEAESRHSEFVGQYQYRCGRPNQLTQLRVNIFERFPLTDEVEASFISADIQTFERLTASDPTLALKP